MMKRSHFFSLSAKLFLALLFTAMILPLASDARALAHAGHDIRIGIKGGFQPDNVSVHVGTTVEWWNREDGTHTVTSDTGLFDSGVIARGDRYVYTFTAAGVYDYSDQLSPIKGTITVLGPPDSAPPPAAPPPVTPAPGPAAFNIGDNFFTPASSSVAASTAVTWTNTGNRPHSVTSDTSLFDSGMLNPGQSFTFTFQNPGQYSYHCLFHGAQTGVITVTGGGTQTPVPQPTPTPVPAPVAAPVPPPLPLPPQAGNSIMIGDNLYSPATLSLVTGTTVTWLNTGQFPHSVTSDSGLFNSGLLNPGQTFTYTFQNPGAYYYHCAFHGNQAGVITVAGGTSNSANQPAQATTPVTLVVVLGPAQGGNGILIADNLYFPGTLPLAAGTTVTWINTGRVPHTVTSDTGLFDSGMLHPGQTFTFTFKSTGDYSYHCTLHEGQIGTITVSGSGTTVSQPAQATSETTPTSRGQIGNTIEIGDNLYSPATLPLDKGNTVTWTNTGHLPHTVTSDTGLFDSGMLNPGQSFTFAFEAPGAYSYHCLYHSGQVGSVTITDTPSAATSPVQASPSEPTLSPEPAPVPGTSPVHIAPREPAPAPEPVNEPAPLPASAPAQAGNSIEIGDNLYSPAMLPLAKGITVTWTNTGRLPHTVTSDTGLFDSGMLRPGQSFTFTFEAAGSYSYHCLYHSGQVGAITVSGTIGSPAAEPTPSGAGGVAGNIGPGDTPANDQFSPVAAETDGLKPLRDFAPPAFVAVTVIALSVGSAVAFRRRKSP